MSARADIEELIAGRPSEQAADQGADRAAVTDRASDDDRADEDRVFAEEQAHLSATYSKLQEMERSTSDHLDATLREIEAFKGNATEEASIDIGGEGEDDVSMETYAQFALMNNVIDSFNLSIDSDKETLEKIRQLLPQPYFAKVTLEFSDRPGQRDIYFGSTGLTDDRHHQLIVDWRAPVAETYYNQGNGPMSYEANGRLVNVDLKLRRQFDLSFDRLKAYFDTTVAIEDPMLLESLARRRSAQLQAITATIQREQNEVIRHPDVPVLLVRGVAGSGKTSVMLQRIAYLLYRERATLNADQVVLITPNPVFERYIWDVLPQLGEKNPRTVRWDQLIDQLGPGDRSLGSEVDASTLQAIEDGIATLTLEPDDVREISAGNWTVLSAKQIWNVLSRALAKNPPSPRLFAQVEEELLFRVDQRIRALAKSNRLRDEMLALSDDEQEAIFGMPIRPDIDNEEEMLPYARTYAATFAGPATSAVESCSWLRLDRIGMRMLGTQSLSAVEWVWLKVVLTGKADDTAKYVMIDEVQDYTEAQLMVLSRYYRRAHFLLLGDPNQAIRPGTASFGQIREVFREARGSVDECTLTTSYRSTPEITNLFAELADEDDGMQISSVHRSGTKPQVIACPGGDAGTGEYLRELVRQIQSGVEQGGLTAVVVNSRRRVHWLEEQLADAMGDNAPLTIGEGVSLPESGAVLLTLELAKGLEFDQVIVADAQAEEFPVTPLSRRRLYTAISRATKRVAILSQGAMTELLASAER
jgi:DNA helicase-2/ATP-dependent DNA helicase PcrA